MNIHSLHRPGREQPTRRIHAQVRATCFEDYGRIAALKVRNGMTARCREAWIALWKSNPAYTNEWSIGWVLETDDGDLVGSIENIPYAYHFRGRQLRVASCAGWVVDASYRGHSLRLIQSVMQQKHVHLVVTTTANPQAGKAFNVLRWSKAPVGTWDQSVFWITNYRGVRKVALGMKSVPFVTLLAYPASAGLFCRDALSGVGNRSNRSTAEIELCSGFDSRFDEFWTDLKCENDDVLLAVRSRETLAWHFQHLLLRGSGWILAATKGSRLIAYALFDREDSSMRMLKRVRIIDFQALRGSENLLSSALSWMLRKCRQEGVHVLENIGCWLDRPGLPQIPAPYRRTLPGWTFYYTALDSALSDALKYPNVRTPSSFDGDISL